MNFFERYALLCRERGIDPCGQKAEQIIGINRTTANKWNMNGTTPKGETVRQLADFFHVSADYLLGRTEDRTDYTQQRPLTSDDEKKLLQVFNGLSPTDQAELLEYGLFKANQATKR